ncbi:MAG: hypothetical protein ABIR22_04790 [Candidatus Eisenbacteria bacterium]
MQDFVRVGVADAGEQARVGERALERVVLAREGGGDVFRAALDRVHAPRVEGGDGKFAAQHV